MKDSRIAHITTLHSAFDTRILYKECKSLAKYFKEVYLIAPSEENFEIDKVKIVSIPRFKNRFLRMTLGDFIAFRKALSLKSHIYHFHDPEFIPWAVLLEKFTRAKVIYDVHEDYFTSIKEKNWIKGNIFKNLLAKLFNYLEKHVAKMFDAVVLAEDYYQDSFKGTNKRLIEILNYPLTYEKPEPLKLSKNTFSIVYSGTVSENRGIWNILKVALKLNEKTSDFKIYIIGKFNPETLEDKVKDFILKNNLKDKVEIVGGKEYVKRELIDSFYQYMDLGLVLIPYSTHYEKKLPTKFFEYMLAGIPFLGTNFPRWTKFVEENRCGLTVNPNDFDEIANKIQYLMKHPDERELMGQNGRKSVLAKYTWDKEEEKLKKLYEELIR